MSFVEINGDIWIFHPENYVVITTNGSLKRDNSCVMGRGIALQAKQRFPRLPYLLGNKLRQFGNRCFIFPELKIITFPVKHNWWEKADLRLIERSCGELVQIANEYALDKVYLVRPGCGNGRLDWRDVKKVLLARLDDRFVVVEKEQGERVRSEIEGVR